jgi:hypothetical protein
MGEPTSVSELLQRAELEQYAAAFEEQGYDSLSQLRDISESDLVDLIKDVKMKNERPCQAAAYRSWVFNRDNRWTIVRVQRIGGRAARDRTTTSTSGAGDSKHEAACAAAGRYNQ